MTFHANIVTLFPELFPGSLGVSIFERARKAGLWDLCVTDLRPFGLGKHHRVDDAPAGGGAGLVLRPDIMGAALDSLATSKGPRIYLSPRGARFDQSMARKWSHYPDLTLICGRFEGLDQRVIDHYELLEISLGDFVLAGGEVAAQAVLEAVLRQIPGVTGNSDSLGEESFEQDLLEYPHYTLPRDWQGRDTPPVLLSGDHKKVAEWRLAEAKALTKARRPDLWASFVARMRTHNW